MRLWVTLFLTCALVPGAEPVSDQIYSAIRANDVPRLRTLTRENGTDTRDRRGNTPLMLAAGFGSLDAVRMLLEAGADPNAVNGVGTTALMWGAHDLAKMQLLVGKGADVNAKTKLNRTALMLAAGSCNSLPLVRFLLASGADPNVVAARGSLAMTEAAARGDEQTAKLLIEKTAPAILKSPVGEQALMAATAAGNLATTRLLLARGVNVNSVSPPRVAPTGRAGELDLGLFTPLILAAAYAPPELVAALLEAGADPNRQDARGATALMLAVATDRARPETVRLLLARDADPRIRDKYGDDAFAWAGKFQNKAVMQALGAPVAVSSPQVTLASAGSKRDIASAVEQAVGLLQKSNVGFLREGGCAACHSHNLTGLAVRAAHAGGLRVDLAHEQEQLNNVLNFMKQFDVLMPQGVNTPGAPDIEQYAMFQLAAGSAKPSLTTDTIVLSLLRQQSASGAWIRGGIPRPPMEDGPIHSTAMGLRVLQQYAPPAMQAESRARIRTAAQWLAAQRPVTTDDRNMQILGLVWADAGAVSHRVKQLVALQRPDGGWAQTVDLGSDAYATGQTLHTLHLAGMKSSDPVYRRGVEFLLRTQGSDGSWHVRSRSLKFQPYFQSGFPYDHDQWISSASTAWAALALAHAVPPPARASLR